jgi:hypothetical protein
LNIVGVLRSLAAARLPCAEDGDAGSACKPRYEQLLAPPRFLPSYTALQRGALASADRAHKETFMPDLNDAQPEVPQEVRAKLEKVEEESRKLDSPERTNDSTVDPDRPVEDILKGYHGG